MSSSSSHATVTYTSISSDLDSLPWGFPLISESDHEAPEAAPQSPEHAPPSHVPAPVYPKYLAPSDDEPIENDPEMHPVDYPTDEEDAKESTEDEEEEDHLAPADSALLVSDSIPSAEETKPFETDESVTPPNEAWTEYVSGDVTS
ncbi:hypothetical protein Tco_0074734 [Tanacetum coccineum]